MFVTTNLIDTYNYGYFWLSTNHKKTMVRLYISITELKSDQFSTEDVVVVTE